jgi:hypothetical protein
MVTSPPPLSDESQWRPDTAIQEVWEKPPSRVLKG